VDQPEDVELKPATPPALTATVLPDLTSVRPEELTVSGEWRPERSERGGTRKGGGGGRPKTPSDIARDALVGRRGEEVVYAQEIERVRRLGFPQERVVWASKIRETEEYDILSVDDDGGDLWIEVKSTVGTDGRFDWSIAEFLKASQEGARYELVRVYEAQSTTPKIKRFRDPVRLYQQELLKLDIGSLRGEVEGAGL
jgi:hypothetical protein